MSDTHPLSSPLTPAVFHILLALADGDKHGYGIMQEVTTITAGAVRMLEASWIEEADERPDPALDDERRRYYRLTPTGQRVAEAKAARLVTLLQVAQTKRLLGDT